MLLRADLGKRKLSIHHQSKGYSRVRIGFSDGLLLTKYSASNAGGIDDLALNQKYSGLKT